MVEITQEKVNYWLNNGHDLNEEMVAPLEKFVSEFPYYPPTQAILAKAYYNTQSEKYTQQLKKASLYVNDRVWLYHFIHQSQPLNTEFGGVKEEISSVPAAELEQPSSEHEAVVQENQTAEIIENEQPNAENEKPIKIEIKQGFGEVLTSESPAIEGLVERKPKLKQDEESIDLPDTNNSEMEDELAEADDEISTDFSVQKEQGEADINEEVLTETEMDKEQIALEVNLPITASEEEITAEIKIEEELAEEVMVEKLEQKEIVKAIVAPDISQHSFLDWLDYTGFDEKSEAVESENEDIAIPNSNVDKAADILAKFIANKPKPGEVKITHYNPEQKSLESDNEANIPVSETLAQVYEQQNEYKMAIEIYQKLALKFPEKSAYFAGLIKNLENR